MTKNKWQAKLHFNRTEKDIFFYFFHQFLSMLLKCQWYLLFSIHHHFLEPPSPIMRITTIYMETGQLCKAASAKYNLEDD